ncbi:MAG: UDP-N-acetyl-alpha-D-glucosamine C6 dehydratase [Alphaproteobacteria bacterium MarineAlpha10_Bin3]|nr:MAG: UDP-N-acetyl-alpha-D-glucosamine C6 dehydratase [Alphaproteobacteria bacterium MarineAlpha10_Bin3]PPR70838.1 MAG: UDP-N-acetyl-alpha-D-glucosamine C6 dehydratase [Alphaproteobacteria bacterium MarineAlpha4_Bin1]
MHDVLMAAASFPLSLFLRVGNEMPYFARSFLFEGTLMFTAVAAGVFWFAGLYRGIWRYASVKDLVALTRAVSLVVLIFLPLLFLFTRLQDVPRSLPLINWFVLLALLGGPRFLYRLFKDRRLEQGQAANGLPRIPVLLIGAGDQAELFIREQARNRNAAYRVIGAVDESGGRVGREIHGVPILGRLEDIDAIIADQLETKPHRMILTKERFDGDTVRNLLTLADAHGMTLARLPRMSELRDGVGDRLEIQPVAVEDLLGRPRTVLDRDAMRELITGRRVLITGAGGTIGSELARQIAAIGPGALILLDHSEYLLYEIDMALAKAHPALDRVPVLGDVRDRGRIDDVIAREKPNLVFHAAALKHVPMVERNPNEGVLTNVIGGRNVADACRAANVELMVQISTDKAVNPANVMGATKRLAEGYCQALDMAGRAAGGTRFAIVRFGNVLGSTGSVVPLFQRQLAQGGPLTVTDPDMTRYFMTVREAVELVLQASALGQSESEGHIFVLDMGKPVRILDLAHQIIRLAGLQPGIDIAIEIIGLRPGEKFHEALLHDAEESVPTRCEGLMLARPRIADLALMTNTFDELEQSARARDTARTLALLHSLVPEFEGGGANTAAAAQ